MELTNTFTPDVAGQEHVAKEKQGNFEGLSVVLRNLGDRRAINFGGLSSSEVNKLLVAAASPELKSPLSKPPVALLQTISSPSTVLQSCWPSPAAGSLQAGSIKIMINIPRTSIDLNRANSFHELRQVKIISDPRTLEPVDDKQRSQLLADVTKTFAFNATSQKQSQVHVITGQMGAGKSTATNTISDELGGNCVIVDYDELKRFVPGYTEEAQKGYPGTVPGCKKMARYLVEGLKSHGFDNRLNMVIQRSINSKDDEMFKLLQESKLNSYNVSLTILAVDKSASTMGILSRYEAGLKNINEEKKSSDGARRTPMEYHEDAYKSLTDLEKFYRLAPELDKVTVSGRAGEIYYQSTKDISPEKIVAAIEQGRVSGETDPVGLFEKLSSLVKFNSQFQNPELREKI